MSSTNKIMSQDVQPVDQRDSDFPHGGKDSTVTFDTSDPANDHAWTINQDTPDTPSRREVGQHACLISRTTHVT